MPDSPFGDMFRVWSVLVHTVKPPKVHRVSPLEPVAGGLGEGAEVTGASIEGNAGTDAGLGDGGVAEEFPFD
jgi:hypothetical protein